MWVHGYQYFDRIRNFSVPACLFAIGASALVVVAFWSSIPDSVRPPLIGAIATLIGASIAASMVVYQLGRQALAAATQNRAVEAMKLKLKIYEAIAKDIESAERVCVDFSAYLTQFTLDLGRAEGEQSVGLPITPPRARVSTLLDAKRAFEEALAAFGRHTENWEIIDPRIEIFRFWMQAGAMDLQAAFDPYFERALRLYPREIARDSGVEVLPWSIPEGGARDEFDLLANSLSGQIWNVGSYVSDFRTEMQILLLGDIFEQRPKRRKPRDPDLVVLVLDEYESLMERLNTTRWGRARDEANALAAQELARRTNS